MAATASVPATEAARQVLARADAAMGFHNQCGLSRASTAKCQYTPDGRLWETSKYGVYEVSSHYSHPAVTCATGYLAQLGVQVAGQCRQGSADG